jgi:hypothetical protein
MKRIKTFGHISESASDTLVYRTKIATYSRSGAPTSIDFYDEPKSLYMARVTDGTAEWTIDLDYRNWGIDIGSNGIKLKSLSMTIEMDDPHTGDPEEDTIELTESDFEYDTFTAEVHRFPLSLTSIEIYMNNSEDTKLWKITLHLGEEDKY